MTVKQCRAWGTEVEIDHIRPVACQNRNERIDSTNFAICFLGRNRNLKHSVPLVREKVICGHNVIELEPMCD